MPRQVIRDPVGLAMDLVNTWDLVADPHELLRDKAFLGHVLRYHGFAEAADTLSGRDLTKARLLRARLRDAFEAPDEQTAATALNDVLAATGTTPRLEPDVGKSWSFRYGRRGKGGVDSVAPDLAAALLDVIRGGDWSRFGLCAGAPCCCVYLDRSKNRSRRYCCDLCADRVNQAAYRRRKGAGR